MVVSTSGAGSRPCCGKASRQQPGVFYVTIRISRIEKMRPAPRLIVKPEDQIAVTLGSETTGIYNHVGKKAEEQVEHGARSINGLLSTI